MPNDFPVDWAKTIAELFADSERSGSSVGPPETEWALAYERSLLRAWARFPVDGDIYEALEDTPVSYLTHRRAPFTGGGEGLLPKGTLVRVTASSIVPDPIRVYADPLDAATIEHLLVPEAERADAKYGGFGLSISTADLNRKYRLIRGAS